MGKRKARHASGNSAWMDAGRRAGRAIRPVAVRAGAAVALGVVEGVTEVVTMSLLK
jgi:hypothetical protein